MGQHFIACDREQTFLMAPDIRAWLPEGHLAWFVLDAVARMDLAVFYGAYRRDGHRRPAFDPGMMVALLYVYARGQRSSRAIERSCEEDVACRVIAANQVPDHTTIARFVSAMRTRWRAVRRGAGHVRVRRSCAGRRDRDRRDEGSRQRL
jgi:transposase